MNKCVLCGEEVEGYGNNAEPIKMGICCDNCNTTKVIPKRLFDATKLSKMLWEGGLCKCVKCMYLWTPRNKDIKPKQCPNCKSYKWMEEK